MAEAVAACLPTNGIGAGAVLKAIGPAAEKAVLPYLNQHDYDKRELVFKLLKDIGAVASVPVLEKIARGQDADAFLCLRRPQGGVANGCRSRRTSGRRRWRI